MNPIKFITSVSRQWTYQRVVLNDGVACLFEHVLTHIADYANYYAYCVFLQLGPLVYFISSLAVEVKVDSKLDTGNNLFRTLTT